MIDPGRHPLTLVGTPVRRVEDPRLLTTGGDVRRRPRPARVPHGHLRHVHRGARARRRRRRAGRTRRARGGRRGRRRRPRHRAVRAGERRLPGGDGPTPARRPGGCATSASRSWPSSRETCSGGGRRRRAGGASTTTRCRRSSGSRPRPPIARCSSRRPAPTGCGTGAAGPTTPTSTRCWPSCEVVVRATFVNQRVAPCPIEPRAGAARWGDDGRLTHWSSCQGAHPVRATLARALRRRRGRGPGGRARRRRQLRRQGAPVPRGAAAPAARPPHRAGRCGGCPPGTDDMVGLGHSRAQHQHVEIGGDRDGTIRALRSHIVDRRRRAPADGAHARQQHRCALARGVRIPSVAWTSTPVVTNTVPLVSYRGAGRPEAGALTERAVDPFAAEIGMDPVEVRRRNLLGADGVPVHHAHRRRLRQRRLPSRHSTSRSTTIDYDGLRAEQARRRADDDPALLGDRRRDVRRPHRRRGRRRVRRRSSSPPTAGWWCTGLDALRAGPPHRVGDARLRPARASRSSASRWCTATPTSSRGAASPADRGRRRTRATRWRRRPTLLVEAARAVAADAARGERPADVAFDPGRPPSPARPATGRFHVAGRAAPARCRGPRWRRPRPDRAAVRVRLHRGGRLVPVRRVRVRGGGRPRHRRGADPAPGLRSTTPG